jgi:hypothetical protein
MKGEPPSAFDFCLRGRAVLDAADAGLEDIRKRDIEEMDLSPMVVREFGLMRVVTGSGAGMGFHRRGVVNPVVGRMKERETDRRRTRLPGVLG